MEPTRHPLNVLVVDDCPDTAHSLSEVLGLCGFRARAAVCGADALRLAAADPPDAVILDLRMPEMDGWEVAERLKRAAKPPLIIAVTGSHMEVDRFRSAEVGAHLHLVKPVEPGLLVGVLGRFARMACPADGRGLPAERAVNPTATPASPSAARGWSGRTGAG